MTVEITAPSDGSVINSDAVTVRGTVSPPTATVQVQGQPAVVGNGVFTADAHLHGGKNTIDVIASAPGLAPRTTSIQVTRASQQRNATPRPSSGGGATPGVAYAQPAPSRTSCGGGLSVGPNTTCSFAGNVESAYRGSGPGTVAVYSPVTNQTYEMTCNNYGGQVTCTGGNNASVYFPE